MNLSKFDDIRVPTLLVDEMKCRRNIRRMADKAKRNKVIFRPHFKTHQSLEIGNWFRDYGVTRITVSSLAMATYFARAGWDDILVAFPVNTREMQLVNDLAGQVNLHLLCQHPEVVDRLDRSLDAPVYGWIKIDVGSRRTGLLPGNIDEIGNILGLMAKSSKIRIMGFLAHAGHTYQGGTVDEMKDLHKESVQQLQDLVTHFSDRYLDLQVSTGDTPCYSKIDEFTGLDEIRPGNFVFYDTMQKSLDSCAADDIAVAMACPVVARHPERRDVILYGGGIHFSKDYLLDQHSNKNFGQLAQWHGDSWEPAMKASRLIKLSQEHGVLRCTQEDFDRLEVGGLAIVLPVHSCMTANLMGKYRALDGKPLDHFSRSSTRMKLN